MGRLVVAAIDRVFRVGLINMKNMIKDWKEMKGLSMQVSGEKSSKQDTHIDQSTKLRACLAYMKNRKNSVWLKQSRNLGEK